MIIKLHGHIGAHAADLVDGRLDPDAEERAWRHVLQCAGCRRLVEAEGWAKRRLSGLGDPDVGSASAVPPALRDNLARLESSRAAWAEVDALDRQAARRRTAVLVAGAGSVGMVAVALLGVTGPLADRDGGRGPDTRRAPANIPTSLPSASPGSATVPSTAAASSAPATNAVPAWVRPDVVRSAGSGVEPGGTITAFRGAAR